MTIEAVFDEAASGKAESKRPYAEYRDVGAVWLGLIPKHWQVMPLKFAVTFQRGHDLPLDERTEGEFPIVTSAGLSGTHNRPAARAPGIVTGRYGTIGAFYIMERDYWPLNTTLYSVHLRGNRPRFLWYMLQNVADIFVLHSLKSAVPGVDRNDLHPTLVAVPPLAEQQAIAAFLDRETAKIDALVEKKRRLIGLLKEKRAALISHAVTKGLNPDVPMKDSEVEWVGDIPEHWQLARIGQYCLVANGSTPRKDNSDYWNGGDIPWLTSAKINEEVIREADQFVTQCALVECHLPIIPARSVLVAITGEGQTRGRAAFLEMDSTISQHLVGITPRRDGRLMAEFIWRTLQSQYAWLRLESSGVGSTRAALTCEYIQTLRIPLPPLSEQAAIVEHVRADEDRLELLMLRVATAIARLLEYRTALISAAVTGKIDVRREV